jgi:uncharacterized protein (DUF58 family)
MFRLRYRLFRLAYWLQRSLLRRLSPGGWGVLSGVVIAAVAGADTYQTLAYQIFTFLLAVLAIDVLFSLTFRQRFGLQRTLPAFASVGSRCGYRVMVHNMGATPQQGLRLLEELADPLPGASESPPLAEMQQAGNFLGQVAVYYRWLWSRVSRPRAKVRPVEIPPIPPQGQVAVRVELLPVRRGPLQLTGVTLLRPGPFGLFYGCRRIAQPQTLWILPRRYALPPLSLPGSRRYQSGGVALAAAVGESEEFRSLRDYQAGDPRRKIHWKSWAKVGKPIVREEQDEFFVRHALILDTFQADQPDASLEAALSIAASFACEVRTQESLLDLLFVGPDAYCFTAGRGVGHTEQMLRILASVEACRDRNFEALESLVLRRAAMLSGCICILLTWDAARQQLVAALRSLQLPTRVLVVAADQSALRTSLPADLPLPADVQVLALDRLQADLMAL